MPWLILALGVVAAIGGVSLIIVICRREGGLGKASQELNIASKKGAMLAGGTLLLLAGLVAITITSLVLFADANTMQEIEGHLTKMFGRPPDRLELDGTGVTSAKGFATYGDKRYRIEVHWASDRYKKEGKTFRDYKLTATPVD